MYERGYYRAAAVDFCSVSSVLQRTKQDGAKTKRHHGGYYLLPMQFQQFNKP